MQFSSYTKLIDVPVLASHKLGHKGTEQGYFKSLIARRVFLVRTGSHLQVRKYRNQLPPPQKCLTSMSIY